MKFEFIHSKENYQQSEQSLQNGYSLASYTSHRGLISNMWGAMDMAQWVRALVLQTRGPEFKSPTLM